MSNRNYAFGMRAIRRIDGGPPVLDRVAIASTAAAIYEGSVIQLTSGGIVMASAIDLGAGTGKVLGVAAEYFHTAALGDTATDIAYWTAEDNVFEIQCDNSAPTAQASFTAASVLWYCFKVTGQAGGSTVTGRSSMQINLTNRVTIGATHGDDHPLRCIGISRSPTDCDIDSAYVNLEVIFTISQTARGKIATT
jgi:hypothetical protein